MKTNFNYNDFQTLKTQFKDLLEHYKNAPHMEAREVILKRSGIISTVLNYSNSQNTILPLPEGIDEYADAMYESQLKSFERMVIEQVKRMTKTNSLTRECVEIMDFIVEPKAYDFTTNCSILNAYLNLLFDDACVVSGIRFAHEGKPINIRQLTTLRAEMINSACNFVKESCATTAALQVVLELNRELLKKQLEAEQPDD